MAEHTKKQTVVSKKQEEAKRTQEHQAKREVLEAVFDDLYANRRRVYWLNFTRGLFFGFGSVLGGTLLIALLVWILSQLEGTVPFLSDFIRQILDALNQRN